MFRNIFAILFSFSILLISCGKSYEKESNAASLVVKEIHATTGNIKVTDYIGTDGKKKSITLTFGGFNDFPKDQSKEMLTSTAAILFIGHLDKGDYEEYAEIKVHLDFYGETYDNKYEMKELMGVESVYGTIQNFMDATNENDFEQVKKIVEEKYIPDTALMSVVTSINTIDSAFGKVNHTKYKGFQFDLLKEDGYSVLICWVQAQHSSSTTDYKFILSRTTKKIVYIGVNETD